MLLRFNIQKSQLIADATPLIGASISRKRVVIRKIFVFCLPSHESLAETSINSLSALQVLSGKR